MTTKTKAKLPTETEVDDFDITGTVCSMHSTPKYPEVYKDRERWEMFSFDRPSYVLWNAVGKELFKNGWTMEEIRCFLQSKYPRWELDGSLAEKIEKIGTELGQRMLKEHAQIKTWVKQGG